MLDNDVRHSLHHGLEYNSPLYLDRHSAYTAGLVVLLCMSTKGGDGDDISMDSTATRDQDLICKCLAALKVCAAYDLVARRFLDILNSIRDSFAISASANRQQKVDANGVHNHVSSTPSKLTRYILNIFSQPFGGESRVIGQNDYVLSKSFPDHWRFLVPELSHPDKGPESSGHSGSSGASSERPPDRGKKRDLKENGPSPTWTQEEYEAFFRRIS